MSDFFCIFVYMKYKTIEELLEQRDILTDIAIELYGDDWVCSDEFWGSITEQQMAEVTDELIELGWINDDDFTPEIEAIIQMLINE